MGTAFTEDVLDAACPYSLIGEYLIRRGIKASRSGYSNCFQGSEACLWLSGGSSGVEAVYTTQHKDCFLEAQREVSQDANHHEGGCTTVTVPDKCPLLVLLKSLPPGSRVIVLPGPESTTFIFPAKDLLLSKSGDLARGLGPTGPVIRNAVQHPNISQTRGMFLYLRLLLSRVQPGDRQILIAGILSHSVTGQSGSWEGASMGDGLDMTHEEAMPQH